MICSIIIMCIVYIHTNIIYVMMGEAGFYRPSLCHIQAPAATRPPSIYVHKGTVVVCLVYIYISYIAYIACPHTTYLHNYHMCIAQIQHKLGAYRQYIYCTYILETYTHTTNRSDDVAPSACGPSINRLKKVRIQWCWLVSKLVLLHSIFCT